MLGIISITILTIFLLVFIILMIIIIGGNKNKTDDEKIIELGEQQQYLIDYKRKEERYSWEQVMAYCIIALNNLQHSANDISLKNMKLFIEPLDKIHSKNDAIKLADQLIKEEK